MTYRLPPRMPPRPRIVECDADCPFEQTQRGDICRCDKADDEWEAEGDRRATEWRERNEREEDEI